MNTKAHIRQSLLALAKHRTSDAVALAHALLNTPAIQNATHIGVYMALPSEPSLSQFIHTVRVSLALPAYDESIKRYVFRTFIPNKTSLSLGGDGCLAPGSNSPVIPQLDVIVVPCVAVDKQGNRLGRGQGVYDQLLADHPTYAIGIVHEAHVLDQVPVEPHDQPVQAIIHG
ncbi:MAG: 5-formyltetrahydrofolate cyclo-ligase [Candidatus Marinamargulisbacteria bacterium]|nr:5-formyltetrahydrofolate cyclo-ligase [Candidatus Marinamargulisbacteria bacterium]